jgi:hypothetical protein
MIRNEVKVTSFIKSQTSKPGQITFKTVSAKIRYIRLLKLVVKRIKGVKAGNADYMVLTNDAEIEHNDTLVG